MAATQILKVASFGRNREGCCLPLNLVLERKNGSMRVQMMYKPHNAFSGLKFIDSR